MSIKLYSLFSSTRDLFNKKGAAITKAMLTAFVISLAGLGLNTRSAEASYSCTNTNFGRHCTGTFKGGSVNTLSRDTIFGRETVGTYGGKTYRKLCRATIFGTECS